MKSIISILIASVFLLQSSSKLLIIADYEINKDFIAKVLCINKKKPKSKCNGKCHLKKQLDKEEKKESSDPNSVEKKSEVQYCSCKKLKLNQVVDIVKSDDEFSYSMPYYDSHLNGVFHPPQV